MRVVFMGTPQLAATVLEYVAAQHTVVGVFTRPDAVRGRGAQLVASPVKQKALELGIPVCEAKSFSDEAAFEQLVAWEPGVICVAAYSALLPARVLELPPAGCLNVHPSLLPRWRGAAPINRAILANDEETGICIMRMEEGLDTGDWCVRRSIPIDGRDAAELSGELAYLGAQALLTALGHLEQGDIEWNPQGNEGVVYAEKIGKRELYVSPEMSCVQAWCAVRASDDNHPSKAVLAGRPVTLGVVSLVRDVPEALAGLAAGDLAYVGKRLYMGFADGALEVLSLRPDGKADMAAEAFAAGIQGIKRGGIVWGELA